MNTKKQINFSWALRQTNDSVVYRICGDRSAWWKHVRFPTLYNAIFEKNGIFELWKGSFTADRSNERGKPRYVAMWIEHQPWALVVKAGERVAAIVPQHYLEEFEALTRSTGSQPETIQRVTNTLEWLLEKAESYELLEDLPKLHQWNKLIAVRTGESEVNHDDVSEEVGHDEIENVDSVLRPEELASITLFDDDFRAKFLREIAERRGQPAFREALLLAYDGQCAISGCNVQDSLEAAHIIPYKGEHSNAIWNGLLLRADLHTLFDVGLITVDSQTLSVELSDRICDSSYAELQGSKIRLPKSRSMYPSKVALMKHREKIFIQD